MNVIIRTDSSLEIGSGHVMRCLTLADFLAKEGARVRFICRELHGNLIDFIRSKGYMVHRLSAGGLQQSPHRTTYDHWLTVDKKTDANEIKSILTETEEQIDWLVIDHYAIDLEWEQAVRQYVGGVMVIDDLANRRHDCDLLLDQNFFENAQERYRNLVPPHCTKLLGPEYALLRPEFREMRAKMPERDGIVNRIMVFFGGVDVTNETAKALEAVRSLDRPDITVDVVIGDSNPYAAQIKDMGSHIANIRLHYQTEKMADLMARADLAIGGGGITTWERCCMGLPCLIIAVADNQVPIGYASEKAGVSRYLGSSNEVTSECLAKELAEIISQSDRIQKMGRRSKALVDGQGARRLVSQINGSYDQRSRDEGRSARIRTAGSD